MRALIVLLFAAALYGCSTSPVALKSIESSPETTPARAAISLEDAFTNQASTLSALTGDIMITHQTTPLIDIAGDKKLAFPVHNDLPHIRTIRIKSYLTSYQEKKQLFYPVISIINDDGNIQGPLVPRYEFAFYNNILTNDFFLPENTSRILIHTEEHYAQHSFPMPVEDSGVISRPLLRDSIKQGVLIGLGGGVVGSLLSSLLSSAIDNETPAPQSWDITLAPVGVLSIEYE